MQELNYTDFAVNLFQNPRLQFPFLGQMELTYRCNLNCMHCYCKDSECKGKELTTAEYKKIIDQIYRAGCIWLTLTGGEPLMREDFLDIYAYAKGKGFLISIFTNGSLLNKKIINYLHKFPPYVVEITLNGITRDTCEAITQVRGSFDKVMNNIHKLVDNKIPLMLKANGLRQNRQEILKIKEFSQQLLGPKRFKFDPFITARLNGDKRPCIFRLLPDEIKNIENKDSDMLSQRISESCRPAHLERDSDFLYQCGSWQNQFFVDPFGRLKLCFLTDRFSTDLRKHSFSTGFYKTFPLILGERFKTASRCRNCRLRPVCYYCPARTYLETGNEEAPVEYFCDLAKNQESQSQKIF